MLGRDQSHPGVCVGMFVVHSRTNLTRRLSRVFPCWSSCSPTRTHTYTLRPCPSLRSRPGFQPYRTSHTTRLLHIRVLHTTTQLLQETVETALQIFNVVGYANRGYSAASIFLYFAMIALNAIVWWMLTYPQTIRVVRGSYMLNGLIAAFYGLFPFWYFFIEGLCGILFKANKDLQRLEWSLGGYSVLLSSTTEAMFGGTTYEVAFKVVTRLVPLFVSISTIHYLVALDYYLKEVQTNSFFLTNTRTTNTDKVGGGTDDTGGGEPDEYAQRESVDRLSLPIPTSTTHTRDISAEIRTDRIVSQPRRGLAKWKVLPVIVLTLSLVVGLCGRLAVLTQECQYDTSTAAGAGGGGNGGGGGDDGKNISGSGIPQPYQPPRHWVNRWCIYRAYPLLATMPGAPSQCACSVVFIAGAIRGAGQQDNETSTCDSGALTQLHDDLVDESRHIAQYLQTLIHHCPSQNVSQTENILAAKLSSATAIVLGRPAARANTTVVSPGAAALRLRGLRAPKLLTFFSDSVPLANLSETAFAKCADLLCLELRNGGLQHIPRLAFANNTALLELWLNRNRLTRLPSLSDNTALAMLNVDHNQLVHLPSLAHNTALTKLWLADNDLAYIPSLATNTALSRVDLAGNRLSSWPASLERLTKLKQFAMQSNQLTSIPAFINKMPTLKYLDVSDNAITTLDGLAAEGVSGVAGPGGENARRNAQQGDNETLLLLGGNPVCANGTVTRMNAAARYQDEPSGGSVLGAQWFASCQSQCSSTCLYSVTWMAAGITDLRGNGKCDRGCNTVQCAYDGGDCAGVVKT